MTVGVLTAFLLYLRQFFAPMEELSQFYNLFQAAAAATEKLSGVLAEPPERARARRAHAAARSARARSASTASSSATASAPCCTTSTSLIPAGQTLAVVGATGAGKTTVARLAARFWDPTDGCVLLDGVDLRDLTEVDLRRAVITVTQESFLFAGSVADNIRLGRPGASRDDIEHAARAIGAHGFISRLPEGYDTDVHQKGARLSSGQRQLVSFARAFLADPAVLILDEATSSLDVPSERLVQHALRTLLEDRTAVIIAHRLTTVEIADRVIVVDAGRIVEDGVAAASSSAATVATPPCTASGSRAWRSVEVRGEDRRRPRRAAGGAGRRWSIGLDEDGWARPSACEGWSVSDVVLHLAQTNEMAIGSARGDFTAPWLNASSRACQPHAGDIDDGAALMVGRAARRSAERRARPVGAVVPATSRAPCSPARPATGCTWVAG